MRKVRQAVITAAGLGTRFLPATKNLPKEMLPIVDVPIIHHVAYECLEAGIEDIYIVIRPGNEAVMNYFTPNKHLDKALIDSGKEKYLEKYYQVADKANFVFVHQKQNLPYGNGSPILTVKSLLTTDPFVVCWGDDLVLNADGLGGVAQVVQCYIDNADAMGVLATTEMPREEVTRYGMVEIEGEESGKIKRIVEKPKLEDVTSNLVEFGRMVLPYEIFDFLADDKTGKDGELWLMDSIHALLSDYPMYATKIEGEFLTTGDPLRYLMASFKFALQRDDLAEPLKEFLRKELEIR
jgi:UTP--glucose-1-phosphate uridylyltransferase